MKRFFLIVFVIAFVFNSCTVAEVKNDNDENKSDIIAAWLNYNEIAELINNSPSKEDFEATIKKVMTELKEYSVNTVFLHVRAFDDCFYVSSIFPVSRYCTDENGRLKFDILETFIKIGHSLNIKIHAWVNPYRISNSMNIDELDEQYWAKKMYNENNDDQRLIICEKGIFYNPASLEAQKHIIDGVKEIINNYNVDGIHFDDYFYPTTLPEIDSDFYNEYIASGGKMTLAEYRRQCVNSLISGVYSAIKNYNDKIIFSVSPSGKINENVDEYYCDVRLWGTKKGYVDYLIPQLYYGFNNENYSFAEAVDDWKSIIGDDVKLIIGLPLYKIGKEDKFAGTGANEWIENNDVISRQISYIRRNGINEFSFYSGSYLYSSNLSENDKNELQSIKNIL